MNPTAASTLNLRFERLWRGLGLFGLLAGLALSLLPIPPPPIELAYADKWQHLVGLALMMLYAGMLFPRQRLRAGLGLLLYGLGIELLQSLLPWRSAEWLDLLADASGIAVGLLLLNTPLRRLLSLLDALLGKIVTLRQS